MSDTTFCTAGSVGQVCGCHERWIGHVCEGEPDPDVELAILRRLHVLEQKLEALTTKVQGIQRENNLWDGS